MFTTSTYTDNSLSSVAQKALPTLANSSLTYNAEKNIYLTLGYTSAAGNLYYRAIRFSDRLAVAYNIGQGYSATFLNGITLFCWDGTKAKIIAERSWGGDDYRFFSEEFARNQSISMLKGYIQSQAKMVGASFSDDQVLNLSRQMIDDTQRKQLA